MSAILSSSPEIQKVNDDLGLDDYHYEKEAGWFRRFLWWCAGADRAILMKCPQSDRVKYEGIGGTVFATALLAACSGGYAFYTVFSPKMGLALSDLQQAMDVPTLVKACIFALLWSLIILNLDRFVVSSAGHGDGTDKITGEEIKAAIPRIIMAAIIGFTLSKPLEIRIMKTEIDAQLNQYQKDMERELNEKSEINYKKSRDRSLEQISVAQAKLDARELEIEKLLSDVKEQQAILDKEVSGESGNRKYGNGPGAQQKRATLEQKRAVWEDAKKRLAFEASALHEDINKAKLDEQKAHVQLEEAQKENVIASHNIDGLMQRIRLGHEFSPIASWTLTFLLMVIEIVPIFFKMMLTRGVYDYLVDNQKEIVKAKYGITERMYVDPNEPTNIKNEMHFKRPEVLLEYQLGQLEVERSLTQLAQQEFRKKLEDEIRSDPMKFVKKAKTN
jgi:hypothetical protein